MGGIGNYPYSLLGKRAAIYGAGIRGRRWYEELSADKAVEVVQWLDKGYLRLKDKLPVTGDMDSLGQVEFDWLVADFASDKVSEEVKAELIKRGVPEEKIYDSARITSWVTEWVNYLRV